MDADVLAHGAMTAGTEVASAIAARFGAGILAADGSVDRAKLGAVVFADPSARRELEAMVHSAVYRAIGAGLRAFELFGDAPLALVDIPLGTCPRNVNTLLVDRLRRRKTATICISFRAKRGY